MRALRPSPIVHLLAILSLLAAPLAAATATIPINGLPQGARLALCGDSITEQRLYTSFVEAYLLACAGRVDVSVFQFGWGGENADQFRNRISRGDLDAFKPTAVSFAYGANDGGGMAWDGWMEGMWNARLDGVVAILRQRYPATVGSTVLCSPTYLQMHSDGTGVEQRTAYNETLSRFRDLALLKARSAGLGFADFRQRMLETGPAAVAAEGPAFRFGGADGTHAGANGHLIMAFELLKALHVDGGIATIRVDFAGGATASAGHQVLAAAAGTLRLSSTRYPFCFNHDRPTAADRPATILPYLPFNQELNRFILVVEHLPTPYADLSWGAETRRVGRADLEAGLNLAAFFPTTPFDAAFSALMDAIARKQEQERVMIKAAGDATASRPGWTAADVLERDRLDALVHAAIVPVQHEIVIRPVAVR